MPIQTKPFDPTSDSDQISDRIRRDVVAMILPWLDDPLYLGLAPEKRLAVVMSGISTGLVCACFSMIEDNPKAHAMMIRAIKEYLPQAREQAEAIDKNAR